MKRFKDILVVYNDIPGADDALTQAAAMAVANGARLTLVDTCPFSHQSPLFVAELEKRLKRTVRSLHLEGVQDADVVVLVGDGPEQVVRQVLRKRHDIVFASGEGGGALHNVLYGAMATELMRKCPCPVWIVKPGQSPGFRRVLGAVDVDPSGPAADPLSSKIIEMASSLASGHNAELHVLHAWEVTGKDADTVYSEVPDATRKHLLDSHQKARRDVLDALLEKHVVGHATPVVHLPRGTPIWEIEETVNAQRIDVVIMGISNRSSLARLLIGNTAENILAAARCGVLTVKPDEFRAPVYLERGLDVA